ncbi:carbohydrate binding family 9 domain-containing protein [Candidatus Poribacteria bacterium]|nr:carbohydrate binding family 9 domain-containing protein [Candidatus Poribacteria bacterium]MYI93452.1 carbohydrate binding family 9 domain-containing protein [Candidatus Poribacteria bacterium]
MLHNTQYRSVMLICIVSSFLLCLNAQAQTIEAQKLQTAPVIDGKLNDITWQQLTPIEEFIIAEFETTVPDRTQVYIGYDDVAIYFGFQCFQPKSTIITTQTRRDGSFQFEDHVAVYLDTYHDRRRTYCFAVNPLGTQRDEKQGDLGWDSEWIAAANIEDSVWTVEMKIPYQLLDLPRTAKQTNMGTKLSASSSEH